MHGEDNHQLIKQVDIAKEVELLIDSNEELIIDLIEDVIEDKEVDKSLLF